MTGRTEPGPDPAGGDEAAERTAAADLAAGEGRQETAEEGHGEAAEAARPGAVDGAEFPAPADTIAALEAGESPDALGAGASAALGSGKSIPLGPGGAGISAEVGAPIALGPGGPGATPGAESSVTPASASPGQATFQDGLGEARSDSGPRAGRWVRGRWIEAPVSPLDWAAARQQRAAPASGEAAGTSLTGIGQEGPATGGGWWRGLTLKREIWAYASIVAVAFLMRVWDLGSRALHHDESLHSYFSFQFYSGHGYQHNPLMHGPFQFHGMAAMFWIFGDSNFSARLLPAITGTAMVLLPLLLRRRLGNVGALFASTMIAFSPALLYYSRFAREDIYMGFWTLALVGLVWRYLDERKSRWLYLVALVVALGFATKENEFMVIAIMGLGLAGIGIKDVGAWIWGHRSLREWGPPASLALVLGLLTLPLVGASVGIFQKFLGMTLAAQDGTPGVATGAPASTPRLDILFIHWSRPYTIAGLIVGTLLIISIVLGARWRPGIWFRMLVVFWAVYIALHTTLFNNMVGVGTGTWQALGYWIGQQDVARGNQPWYYYFIIVSIYEFLPWTVTIGAAGYFIRKGDVFSRFLVFWAVATFLAYTIASEKMPWLLVHVTLPLIIVTAKALGNVATAIDWRKALSRGGIYVLAGLPLLVSMLWHVLYFNWDAANRAGSFFLIWGQLTVIGVLLAMFYLLSRKIGRRAAFAVALAVSVIFMMGFTIRAGVVAAYVHGDVPQEMLVYTQTAPDIADLADEIDRIGVLTQEREKLKITIDAADGFTWPWAWYLRNYPNTGYPDYTTSVPATAPDSAVVVVNYQNKFAMDPVLADKFTPARRIAHRWWFPEEYRGLTPSTFFGTIVDPRRWRGAVDYFLYRKLSHELGRVEAYVYINKDIPLQALQ